MAKSISKSEVHHFNTRSQPYVLNYPLLILLAAIPLQNIYLGKIPSLGMGINFLNVMTLLAFLSWRMNKEFRAPTISELNKPLLLFCIIYVLSLFYGIFTLGEMGERHIEKLKDILIPILIYFIVLNSVRDKRGIIITLIATFVPLPYMFHVFRTQLSGVLRWHYDHDYRISGTFMELGSNEIAAFYAGYTLILIGLFVYIKNNVIRALIGILVILNTYCLVYSYSRGSWLSFAIGCAILVYFVKRKLFFITIALLPILWGSALTIFPVSVQERMNTIFVENEEDRDASAQSRFIIWENAMSEYAKSPIIGIGFHTFHHINPYDGKDTHNYYVKLLTEQGIIGLWVFLLILLRGTKLSLKLFQNASDYLYKAIGLGVIAMIAAFSFGNLFGDRLSHYPLSTYFWVYIALAQRAYILTQESITSKSVKAVKA